LLAGIENLNIHSSDFNLTVIGQSLIEAGGAVIIFAITVAKILKELSR